MRSEPARKICVRVRQHLGGGSPNTISPMLDVWFERLSARVAGVAVPIENDLPPNLRTAWNHAKLEARTLANEALMEERTALEQGRVQLSADQAEMARREEQWVGIGVSIRLGCSIVAFSRNRFSLKGLYAAAISPWSRSPPPASVTGAQLSARRARAVFRLRCRRNGRRGASCQTPPKTGAFRPEGARLR